CLLSIELMPIKPLIDDGLEASPHGQEEPGNRESGDHQHYWLRSLPGEELGYALQPDDETSVDHRQQRRQRAVDQRLVDDGIDVPESIAQNSNTDGEGEGEKEEKLKELVQQLVGRVRRDYTSNDLASDNDHYPYADPKHHPLGLLPLRRR